MNRIFLLVLLLSFLCADARSRVIVEIGDDVITVEDFIQRAEYTPRPLYCRGNTDLDKRIILNTLIGEKLFSMEMNKDIPTIIQDYLIGRKNQKMREILFNYTTQSELTKMDDFSHWYNLASIEYDISYLSILDANLIREINEKIAENESLEDIHFSYTGRRDIPNREKLNLFTIDNRALREELFLTERKSGDILGPITTDDNIIMFVEINKKKKNINLNPNSIAQTKDEISTLIATHLRENKYQYFVENLMSDMKFELNGEVYLEFSQSIEKWYQQMGKIANTNHIDDGFSKLKIKNSNNILLTLNGDDITLNEVLKWIRIHPLVFRDGYYKNLEFSEQLKFSLADLIRDQVLNLRSKELNLDKDKEVLSEYDTWHDNYSAIKQREEIIGENFQLSSVRVSPELNEYFTDLTQKYSELIKIDLEALNDITLSSIDMVTYNKVGPYKLAVPFFPIITDTYKFDYGQSITMRNK